MGLTFNGISSDTLGIVVEHPPKRVLPERDIQVIPVPGRNQDVIIDNGSYKNVKREYEIALGTEDSDFDLCADAIAAWLNTASGYCRLEDDYDEDHYRMARVSGETDIENILGIAGRTTVTFDCGPQRFLLSGEEPVEFQKSGKITNPTNHTAEPVVQVKLEIGTSGHVQIGSYGFTIQATSGSNGTTVDYVQDNVSDYVLDSTGDKIGSTTVVEVYVDSNLGYVYSENVNTQNMTVITDYTFPVLPPGDTSISFNGGVKQVSIVPRWWEV